MKDRQSLGDVPTEEFRKQLHELADWIADYREHIAERQIAPNDKPGAILAQLDRTAPETAAPLDEIFADIKRVIVPGVAHWAHPQFMSYFGCTTTSPGILAEMITGALNVNAMTWRTSPAATELETLVLDWLRQWLGLPNEFEGVVYDTASISTMHALAETAYRCGSAVKKTFVDWDCSCFFRTAHRQRVDNAGTSTESDRGLLEPALERSPWFIFDHAGRKRFWPKRKIVARPNRASDKFDVASERARR